MTFVANLGLCLTWKLNYNKCAVRKKKLTMVRTGDARGFRHPQGEGGGARLPWVKEAPISIDTIDMTVCPVSTWLELNAQILVQTPVWIWLQTPF